MGSLPPDGQQNLRCFDATLSLLHDFRRNRQDRIARMPKPESHSVDSDRSQARQQWTTTALQALGRVTTAPPVALTAEASNRRFYRLATTTGTLVLMDAPPATEKNREYAAIADWLQRQGLRAPQIHAQAVEQGFFLLEDLGDQLFADGLQPGAVTANQALDRRAIDTLVRLQQASLKHPPAALPHYDDGRLQRELGLFEQHFLQELLGLELPANWEPARTALIQNNLEQPRVGVYLDYHSRNLLCLPDGDLGLVDFQDLLWGPVSYDLVSLLRDCYFRRDPNTIAAGVDYYLQQAAAHDIPGTADTAAFQRWFDLCGLQRHLKALGIFARLYVEGGRTDYLADLPRVLDYASDVAATHPDLKTLGEWLGETVMPATRQRLIDLIEWPAP